LAPLARELLVKEIVVDGEIALIIVVGVVEPEVLAQMRMLYQMVGQAH
jgi:hypothetical protein